MNSTRDRLGDSTLVADAMTITGSTMSADATVVGDAPTRIHSISSCLAKPPPRAAQTSLPPTALSRPVPVRKGTAVSAAVVAAFALGVIAGSIGTRRAEGSHRTTPVCTPATPAIVSPPVADSSDGPTEPRPGALSERVAVEPPGLDTGRGSSGAAPGVGTKARVAADAFATGDYAQALAVYEELAAEEPRNRAYIQAANVLRSWLSPAAHAMRQPLPMREPP